MRVILPSRGILGQRAVNMRMLTLSDLRDLNQQNIEEPLRKLWVVSRVCEDIDMYRVSKNDVDYLFTLATFALMLNSITYKVTCPHCEKEFKTDVSLSSQEVQDLDKSKSSYVKETKQGTYRFRVISADQYRQACEYALGQDDFEEALNDAVSAFTLGMTFNEIEEIKKKELPIYLATLLFQATVYHGLSYKQETTCPHCKKEFKFNYTVDSSILQISPERIINNFVGVADFVTFGDYLNLTLTEYNGMVTAINKRFE